MINLYEEEVARLFLHDFSEFARGQLQNCRHMKANWYVCLLKDEQLQGYYDPQCRLKLIARENSAPMNIKDRLLSHSNQISCLSLNSR